MLDCDKCFYNEIFELVDSLVMMELSIHLCVSVLKQWSV